MPANRGTLQRVCKMLCRTREPSGAVRKFEPMFDSKMTSSERLVDAVDLAIDFATLGEYGLEPLDRPAPPCERRRHGGSRRSTGAWSAAIDRFAVQS